MNKIDRKSLDIITITVKSQQELNSIPLSFGGKIYIEFGNRLNPAIVSNRYILSAEARGNSCVEAWGNSHVEALENSHVIARENSHVEACENSHVIARENSHVEALGNSHVEAWENSHVIARENSHVEACENSCVEARGNSQVLALSSSARIKKSGNSRIVHYPKTIYEFMDFYAIKHNKKKAIFYKAVHKSYDIYFSDYDNSFLYNIGQKLKVNCDSNSKESCSYGIHIAHLNWALNYGCHWKDLAIIEVETDISKIVLPKNSFGKVRTSEITVLREVPLEECGLYGKILAKKTQR